MTTSSNSTAYLSGKFSVKNRTTFSPMIIRISCSECPVSSIASVICTNPVVSKGVVTAPSKSDPSATCSAPNLLSP